MTQTLLKKKLLRKMKRTTEFGAGLVKKVKPMMTKRTKLAKQTKLKKIMTTPQGLVFTIAKVKTTKPAVTKTMTTTTKKRPKKILTTQPKIILKKTTIIAKANTLLLRLIGEMGLRNPKTTRT